MKSLDAVSSRHLGGFDLVANTFSGLCESGCGPERHRDDFADWLGRSCRARCKQNFCDQSISNFFDVNGLVGKLAVAMGMRHQC